MIRGPPCKHTRHGEHLREVFQVGAARVFAGGVDDVWNDATRVRPKLLVCVGGESVSRMLDDGVTLNQGARRLLPELARVEYPQVVVEWRDHAAPDLTLGWWKRLVAGISRIDGNVVVFCLGGHGRTGTALSILASLAGAAEGDPVLWVRRVYCDEAVESTQQVEYLRDMRVMTRADPTFLSPPRAGGMGPCIVCQKPAPADGPEGVPVHEACYERAFEPDLFFPR